MLFADDPLSDAAFESAVGEHMAAIATRLARIDAEIAAIDANGDSAELQNLRTMRVLLLSGLFDAAFYCETYADIRAAGVDPLTHYMVYGEAEGRSPNSVFIPSYYRHHAMAGEPAGRNALVHYIEEGERLGRKPHPGFDPQAYLAVNASLAQFVDRPLFHFLKVGQAAGLPVAPGPRGAAPARVLEAHSHAANFERSGRGDLYQLMRFKQAVVDALGIDGGFAFYKEAFGLPHSDQIRLKPLASLYEFAKNGPGAFHQIAPAGERFVVTPPPVIGEGNHRVLEGIARSAFVACVINARLRARSGFIEVDDAALFDYEGDELARIDEELEFDPAVFCGTADAAWIIAPQDEASILELDEAFTLLGCHTVAFGHWISEYLPKYVAAKASGALPPVPVLIDEAMPATHRQALEMLLPEGVRVIALPPFAMVRVRRLWCAPGQMYWGILEKFSERTRWEYNLIPPARLAAVFREMVRTIEPIVAGSTGAERVFLARKGSLRRKLVNAAAIQSAAEARGFAVVYPEDLSFAEQVRLLRHARYVVAPNGAACMLALFARPGTRLCILSHPYTVGLSFGEIGLDITVLTGPYVHEDEEYLQFSDYEIDEKVFSDFLDTWLEDDSQPRRTAIDKQSAPRFAFSCVVENTPALTAQAFIWVNCVKRIKGINASDIFVHVLGLDGSEFMKWLERENVHIVPIDRFDPRSPHCNKIQQLATFDQAVYDQIVLMDCDTALIGPSELPLGSPVSACIVNQANPSERVLLNIFDAAGLGIPDWWPVEFGEGSGHDLTDLNNCNGGLYICDRAFTARLAPVWRFWALWCLDNIELFELFAMFVDQVSFALAMRELGAKVNHLPITWNYPTHLPVERLPDIRPEVIHYHREFDSNLQLKTLGLAKVDEVISKLNNDIANFIRGSYRDVVFVAADKLEHQRGRGVVSGDRTSADLGKVVVGSGWWCDGKPHDWAIGSEPTRSVAFFDLWYRQVVSCLQPDRIVIIDSASPTKPNFHSYPVAWVELDRNYGHPNDIRVGRIATKYSGFTRSVIGSAMYALCCDADFYVYVEQDCLLHGEDFLIHALGNTSEDILLGAPTENGKGLDGSAAASMLQQSLIIVRRAGMERFLQGLLGAPWTDGECSPEEIMRLRMAPYDLVQLPYGRSRPIDFDRSHFYAQHLDGSELRDFVALVGTGRRTHEVVTRPSKVSVLLNTYNQRQYVAAALDSILIQQTTFPFEVIVWDDGSTDGTQDIILKYAARDPEKFQLVFNPKNSNGPDWIPQWWSIMRKAGGTYIALIEGDDYWIDGAKLQKQVDFLDANPGFVLCGHNNVIRNEWTDTETVRSGHSADRTVSIKELLVGNILHTSSLMYRNGVLRDWPTEFMDVEATDWPLHILLAQCGRVCILADAMSTYRIHSGGAWSGKYRIHFEKPVPDIRPEAWKVIIGFWELFNKHLRYQYDDYIQSLIDRKQEEIARIESAKLCGRRQSVSLNS